MLKFDEEQMIAHLDRLPTKLRVVFAVTCAERLKRSYCRFSEITGRGDPGRFTSLLDGLWRNLEGNLVATDDACAQIDACMALIPQEDDGPWVIEQAFAEDAASALAYALRCYQSGNSQESAWAARCAYETVDHYVVHHENVDTNVIGPEERVLSHYLVQAELMRQHRDLQELVIAAQGTTVEGLTSCFRARANAESKMLFSGLL